MKWNYDVPVKIIDLRIFHNLEKNLEKYYKHAYAIFLDGHLTHWTYLPMSKLQNSIIFYAINTINSNFAKSMMFSGKVGDIFKKHNQWDFVLLKFGRIIFISHIDNYRSIYSKIYIYERINIHTYIVLKHIFIH